jgi:hypothetical protein
MKRWISMLAVLIMCGSLAGCLTPAGYDSDLTPGHNGEEWIQGGSGHIGPFSAGIGNLVRAGARDEMRAYLAEHPRCEWCGGTYKLQVHHRWPVSVRPDLASDPGNMLTLCGGDRCHFVLGHKCDWRTFNARLAEWVGR